MTRISRMIISEEKSAYHVMYPEPRWAACLWVQWEKMSLSES
jgi:hypothetical protein